MDTFEKTKQRVLEELNASAEQDGKEREKEEELSEKGEKDEGTKTAKNDANEPNTPPSRRRASAGKKTKSKKTSSPKDSKAPKGVSKRAAAKRKSDEKNREIAAEAVSIGIFCLSLLVIIGVYFGGGGIIGQKFGQILKGFFGFGAYILPLIVIGFCVYMFFAEKKELSAQKTIMLAAMFFVVTAFFHVIHVGSGDVNKGGSFLEYSKMSFMQGGRQNGGLLGAYIGDLLYLLIGRLSIVFLIMGFLCLCVLLSGRSFFGLVKDIWGRFSSYFVFESGEELNYSEDEPEEELSYPRDDFSDNAKKKDIFSFFKGIFKRDNVDENADGTVDIREQVKRERMAQRQKEEEERCAAERIKAQQQRRIEERQRAENERKQAQREYYRQLPKPTVINIDPNAAQRQNKKLEIALDAVTTADRQRIEPAKSRKVEANVPDFIKNREPFEYEKFLERGKVGGIDYQEPNRLQTADDNAEPEFRREDGGNAQAQNLGTNQIEPEVGFYASDFAQYSVEEPTIDVRGILSADEDYADIINEGNIDYFDDLCDTAYESADIDEDDYENYPPNDLDDEDVEYNKSDYEHEAAQNEENTDYYQDIIDSDEELQNIRNTFDEVYGSDDYQDLDFTNPPFQDESDEDEENQDNEYQDGSFSSSFDTPPWQDVNNAENEAKNKTKNEAKMPVIVKADAPMPVREREVKRAEYVFPKLDFLGKNPGMFDTRSSEIELLENSKILVRTLASFNVESQVIEISKGPAVTRYELCIADGIKVSKILGLADNLALSLAATSIRIEAPIPGKSAVGIEIPNREVTSVYLSEVVCDKRFQSFDSKLAFGLGKDIAGNVVVTDIAKMPHMLIAGATGSGKSVCINTLITSILYKAAPDEVRLIMVDPKVVELSVYNGIPHLLIPVVTEADKAAGALNWAVHEMMERYNRFAQTGTRNLKGYNQVLEEKGEKKLPQIVIIIDELADLMMVAAKEVEAAICRLAQLARAAGIYLIIATQRPSVDVITGLIKANIPSRIAFAVSSGTDSRTIIDTVGAEKLLGKGDMLFKSVDMNKALRVQGAFVTDKEIENIVSYIKENNPAVYDEDVINKIDNMTISDDTSSSGGDAGTDELTDEVIAYIVKKGKCSTSLIQRQFRIGYNRAARIVDELEDRGIIGPDTGTSKPRDVLMDKYQLEEYFTRNAGY